MSFRGHGLDHACVYERAQMVGYLLRKSSSQQSTLCILSHRLRKAEPLRGFPFSSYEKETSFKWLGGCTFTTELESQVLKQHPTGFK